MMTVAFVGGMRAEFCTRLDMSDAVRGGDSDLFEGGMEELWVASHLLLTGLCWWVLEVHLWLQHCTHTTISQLQSVFACMRNVIMVTFVCLSLQHRILSTGSEHIVSSILHPPRA